MVATESSSMGSTMGNFHSRAADQSGGGPVTHPAASTKTGKDSRLMPYYRPSVARSFVLLIFLACHREPAETPAGSHAPGQLGNAAITGHVSLHGEPTPAPSTATKL